MGGFQNPGVCRQAFPSFLPHPLPLLLLAPFSRCNSLLPNPTETLATQAKLYEKSVSSLLSEFEAVLQFLYMFADSQATATGQLKKVQNAKFVGTSYILGNVLPILTELSLSFQSGYLIFSQIGPSIEMAKLRLSNVLEGKSPLEKLEHDIDSLTAMSSELTFPGNVYEIHHLTTSEHRRSFCKHYRHSTALTRCMSQMKTSLVFSHTVTSTLQPLLTSCMTVWIVTAGLEKKLNSKHNG